MSCKSCAVDVTGMIQGWKKVSEKVPEEWGLMVVPLLPCSIPVRYPSGRPPSKGCKECSVLLCIGSEMLLHSKQKGSPHQASLKCYCVQRLDRDYLRSLESLAWIESQREEQRGQKIVHDTLSWGGMVETGIITEEKG